MNDTEEPLRLDKETCDMLRKGAAERGITMGEFLQEILEQAGRQQGKIIASP